MADRKIFMVISSAGINRDLSKGTREQAYWDEHAAFIDPMVDEGFIVMGGPLPDEGGAILIVRAEDEAAVHIRLRDDPWYRHAILHLDSIKRWEIFIDQRGN